MDMIVGGKKSGKTTEVIEWLKADSKRIVVYPNSTLAQTFKTAHPELAGQVKVKGATIPTGGQVCYEEAQMYLPQGATLITMTLDGKLKAMTNYNIATA